MLLSGFSKFHGLWLAPGRIGMVRVGSGQRAVWGGYVEIGGDELRRDLRDDSVSKTFEDSHAGGKPMSQRVN